MVCKAVGSGCWGLIRSRSSSVQALLVRALLCFGRACLRPGLLSLGFLGSHVTLRGSLVLLGLAFSLERLVPGYGPGRFLGSALHVFYDAFDFCLRSRLTRQNRRPLSFHRRALALPRQRPLPGGPRRKLSQQAPARSRGVGARSAQIATDHQIATDQYRQTPPTEAASTAAVCVTSYRPGATDPGQWPPVFLRSSDTDRSATQSPTSGTLAAQG